ncbi:MAG: serine hydrolase [Jatrophihabitantaceae bacterium]
MPTLLRRLAVAVTAPALLSTACANPAANPRAPGADATPGGSGAPTTPATPSLTLPTGPTPAQLRAAARARLSAAIAAQPAGGVSVAAVNVATGRAFAAGAHGGMRTASAYKLLMVVAVLLQHDGLSDYEDELATSALENSDNAAGYNLYLDAGGISGVQDTLDDLGMTHTVCSSSDPTLTRTSAGDYLRLLRVLVTPGKISRDGRAGVLAMMRDVEADQRWGVGVVADKGTTFANKNGWLSIDDSNGPGDSDRGLWAVASVGIVTVHGQQLLMSVFTQHQSDFATGVRLVERLARLTAPMVARV